MQKCDRKWEGGITGRRFKINMHVVFNAVMVTVVSEKVPVVHRVIQLHITLLCAFYFPREKEV